jgi:GT2 family glycosyltransferase
MDLRRQSRLPPTASVIIPTCGRPEKLGRLLSTLADQDIGPDEYEVIVVDDGSPNRTDPIVSRLAKESAVSLWCVRTNHRGPAVARTTGAGHARGELLIFVDDDMLIETNFVREHIASHRQAGLAAVNCDFDWKIQARPEPFRCWYSRRVQEWAAARRAAFRPVGEGLFEIPNVLLTTANLSVMRADYERVGGFDTEYPFSCEDQDFGLRLGDAGVRGLVTARTRATHVDSGESLQSVCRRQQRGARDTVRFMRRYSLLDRPRESTFVRVNDPLTLGVDPWCLLATKMLKTLIASGAVSPLLFGAIALWGRFPLWPSTRERGYELIVSAYARKGWCQGRRLYGTGVSALQRDKVTRGA